MAEKQICIYKLPMEKIMEHKNHIDGYTDERAIMNGELVPISASQLTGKIYDYYSENGLDELTVKDAIVNIVVPTANGKNANAACIKNLFIVVSSFIRLIQSYPTDAWFSIQTLVIGVIS